MKNSRAMILGMNPTGAAVAASAARLSTRGGTAIELFGTAGDGDKDARLIGKVLSSGHRSVIEHHVFSVAFDNVSVLTEQFLIELRLASFTVKSRRYVDFSDAGYVMPEDLPPDVQERYKGFMDRCFETYQQLVALDVPREDARFVLPYALRSNFYATINARELLYLICSMLKGRGRHVPELVGLGSQLKEQFDQLYPGLADKELGKFSAPREKAHGEVYREPAPRKAYAELLSAPDDTNALLLKALRFTGRFSLDGDAAIGPDLMRDLLKDTRARELEFLNYAFHISDISLACLTHFSRHRMQSPLIPDVLEALQGGGYVMPPSILERGDAEKTYVGFFGTQHEAVKALQALKAPESVLSYLAVSGNTIDMMTSMNARELLHFARLRTCRRAQWEIQDVARQMLRALCGVSLELFGAYGPSCALDGACPEGRMSCGRPVEVQAGVWKDRT